MNDKNYMDANMATLFAKGVLWMPCSWATSNLQTRNFTSKEFQLKVFSKLFIPILSTIPTIATNSLVLGGTT
jgi:hypothetical protein